MSKYCAYKLCSSKSGTGISLFPFPKREAKCKLWAEKCNREDILDEGYNVIQKNYRLCEKHFEAKYIGSSSSNRRKFLYGDAIPTIFQHSVKSSIVQKIPIEILRPATEVIPGSQYQDVSLVKSEVQIEKTDIKAEDPLKLPDNHISQKLQNPMNILEAALKGVPTPDMTQRPLILKQVSPPKGAILRQIKQISANQAEVIKNLQFVIITKQEPPEKVPITATVDLTLDDNNETYDQNVDGKNSKVELVNTEQNDSNDTPSSSSNKNDADDDNERDKNGEIGRTGNLCTISDCFGARKYYFRVPSSRRTLSIWRLCVGKPALQAGDLICNEHFLDVDILETPDDGNIGKLKEHVVPSLEKIQSGCIMPSCENRFVNAPNMYAIPVWSTFSSWTKFIGHIRYSVISELLKYRMCDRHFSAVTPNSMFHLVPDINLPPSGTFNDQLQEFLKKRQESEVKYKYKSESSCASSKCYREPTDEGAQFTKFPRQYNQALAWLALCNRRDILFKNQIEIYKFIANSNGVCEYHYQDICKNISNTAQGVCREISNYTDLEKGSSDTSGKSAENPHGTSATKVYGDKTTVERDHEYDAYAPRDDSDTSNKASESNQLADIGEPYSPSREYCAFINCSTHIKNPIRKYRFPRDKNLLKKWKAAAGISDSIEVGPSFICSKHFTEAHYTDSDTLKMSSVPEPYYSYVDTKAMDENLHWIRKQRFSAMNYTGTPMNTDLTCSESSIQLPDNSLQWADKCCVKHCESDKKSETLFEFPVKNLCKFELWIKAVENYPYISAETTSSYKKKQICSKHFEQTYLTGEDLSPEAIPTLDLYDEKDIGSADDLDTDIVWQECTSKIYDHDPPYVKEKIRGKAILRENSIEFPYLRQELRFGKDCKRKGINRFPYKLHRPHYSEDNIPVGHKIQIHTAIIVDDDDASEKTALDMIHEVLKRNESNRRTKATKKPRLS